MKRILAALLCVCTALGLLSACTAADTAASEPTVPASEQVSSADDLSGRLGFTMASFSYKDFIAYQYLLCDGKIGEIDYKNGDGKQLRLRMQQINDDISGLTGAQDGGMHRIGKTDIWFGYLKTTQVAQWGKDGFTYCLIGDGMGSAAFREAVLKLEEKLYADK